MAAPGIRPQLTVFTPWESLMDTSPAQPVRCSSPWLKEPRWTFPLGLVKPTSQDLCCVWRLAGWLVCTRLSLRFSPFPVKLQAPVLEVQRLDDWSREVTHPIG